MATHESSGGFDARPGLTSAFGGLAVVLGAFLVSAVLALWFSPVRSTIGSAAVLPGVIPLRTAGADPTVVLASLSMGLSRLYLTGVPAALLAFGTAVSLFGRGRTWTLGVGAICGVLAAGTLTVLSGCHCSVGSTTPLWRSAGYALSNGLGPLTVLGPTALVALVLPAALSGSSGT